MEILGYIFAIFIGLFLGLIGSGGSILCIPVLVYLLGIEPQKATVYSLFIVGFVSFIGSIKNFKSKLIDIKITMLFGLPSIVAVVLMRKCIYPKISNIIFEINNIVLTKNTLIMLVFSSLMILASFSMISKNKNNNQEKEVNNLQLIINGIVIGLIAGFVGVGGGFLIIPVLFFYAKLPMNKAIATSLAIISINSIIGFLSSIDSLELDWKIIIVFSSFATIGIFIGSYLSRFFSNEKLKPIFGWFILVMGIYIIIRETIL